MLSASLNKTFPSYLLYEDVEELSLLDGGEGMQVVFGELRQFRLAGLNPLVTQRNAGITQGGVVPAQTIKIIFLLPVDVYYVALRYSVCS